MNDTIKIPEEIIAMLLDAEGKALATWSGTDVNVIPVSSIRVSDGQIWLINYFMNKTYQNIVRNPQVALACWKGLKGYQIKGKACVYSEGPLFDTARAWIAEILPERIVRSLIMISPLEIYDVAASVERAGRKMI